MIVDLNDKAFKDAKQNDIFIIEEKNDKKYARPVAINELFEEQFKQLDECQKNCFDFKEIVKEQKEEIANLKKFINEKLNLIAKIVGGYDDEEK